MKKLNIIQYLIIAGLSITWLTGCGSASDSAEKFIKSGKEFIAKGEPEKARLQFKNAIQVEPKVAESYYQLALLDEKAKKWKSMFAHLSKVEQLDPKHFDAINKIGQLYLLSGDATLAKKQVDKVLKDDPDNLMAWVLKSSIELKNEEYESAMQDVDYALSLSPTSVEATSLKAILLNKTGQPNQALNILTSLLKEKPNELPLTTIKLSILEEQKDYVAMEAIYNRLKTKHTSEAWVFVSLAKLYNLQGQYAKAKEVLEGFVNANPEQKETKMLLVSLVQPSEPEKALALLESYIQYDLNDFDFRSAKIQLLIKTGQQQSAISELEKIVALDDGANSNKANIMLAGLDMQNKDQEAASKKLDAVLSQVPDDEGALLMKAKIEVLNSDIDSAVTRLRMVLRNNPESEQALILLAQAYMSSGSTELAEDNFRQALTVNPGNTVAALFVAKGLIKENDLNRTENILTNALKKTPNNAPILQTLAQVKLLKKDWLGTQSIVDTLLQNDQNSVVASYLSARISQGQERYAEAIDEYKKVLETRPEVSRALQGLAFCSMRLNQKSELLAYLKEFTTKNPRQFTSYVIQSNLWANDKSYPQAIEVLQEGLTIEPKWLSGYSALAFVYSKQGRFEQAVSAYLNGLKVAPDNDRLTMQLASLYEKNENFFEAKQLYEQVLKRDKNNELVINNLASLLTDQFRSAKNLERAKEITQSFESATQPYFLDSFAWVRVQLGELDTAQPALERVISLAPNVAVFNYHLGVLHKKLNNQELANKYLTAAKQLADEQADESTAKKAKDLLVPT